MSCPCEEDLGTQTEKQHLEALSGSQPHKDVAGPEVMVQPSRPRHGPAVAITVAQHNLRFLTQAQLTVLACL